MIFMKKGIAIMAVCAAMGLSSAPLRAQDAANPIQLKGIVIDETGAPAAGAVIRTSNSGNETIAGNDGEYNLTVNDGSKYITVYYVGTNPRTMLVSAAAKDPNISLYEEPGSLDEVIDLGYTKATRRELTGAVSVVTGTELDKSPESNLGKTFAGRLAGLTVIENNGEPGRSVSSSTTNGMSLLVRGISTINGNKPLIVIDGQISPNVDYTYITPEEIETVTVLKDAAATAIYGMQGGNGVIVITTKRGKIGAKQSVSVYVDEALQQATHTPLFVGASDYARMRNQAGYNDGLGLYSQFSKEEIERYDAGNDPYFPSNDWYNRYMNKTIWMTRAGLSLSGGNDRLQYYANVNYMHETSPFKTDVADDAKYNPTPNVNRFNFRSNIDVKITSYLKALMRISGTINNTKTSGHSNSDIYKTLFYLPPTMFGPTIPEFDAEGNPMNGAGQIVTVEGEEASPYGYINRTGYIHNLSAAIMAQGGLELDLGMVTKGLSAKGIVGYQTTSNNFTSTRQTFQRWVRTNDLDKFEFTRVGEKDNTPLSYTKTQEMYYNLNLSGYLNYMRSFGDHYVNAMAYVFYQNREVEETSGAGVLPYKRETLGVTATYGFRNRYFIRAELGYSGSEQFHPDHRWTATPAVSASWIASDESFMQPLKPWLNLAKLRASYGITANDQLSDERGLYMDNVDYTGKEFMRGNPLLAPEKFKKQNYGIDLGFFNGSLNLSFDWYRIMCDNILVSGAGLIPSYQGIPTEYFPMVNEGRIHNQGYEISAYWNKSLNRDWSIFLGGSFSYNKNKIDNVKEVARDGYAYPYENAGQSIGQKWGYVIDYSNGNGFFNFEDEITGSGLTYSGKGLAAPRVGDFRYKDLNNDGTIDEKDKAPIGYSNCPRGYYNFSAGFNWKGLEVSLLFQGTTKRSVVLSGIGAYEGQKQGVFNDIHMNAWTAERFNNGEQIDYPALSLGQSASNQPNSFFIMDGSYLRLKNAEIAYTLPVNVSRKIMAEKIRFALSGQNLFTIDNMRSKHIDPEIGDLSAFQTYRVINLGVRVTF